MAKIELLAVLKKSAVNEKMMSRMMKIMIIVWGLPRYMIQFLIK